MFTVIERSEESVLVETVDGRFTVPVNPQRIVCLDSEFTTLFPLGITSQYAGINVQDDGQPSRMGEMTEELWAVLDDVPQIEDIWELDVERVFELEPDLVLGRTVYQTPENYDAISLVAPFIRIGPSAYALPRQGLRDYGSLFGLSDRAEALIADHDDFVERAKAVLAPIMQGKKVAILASGGDGSIGAFPTYFITSKGMYGEDGKLQPTNATSTPFFRELSLTPSTYIEQLADDDDRNSAIFMMSMEDLNRIDADYLFFAGDEDQTKWFRDHPLTRSTEAGRSDRVYTYDYTFGRGLPAVRAAVAWIVEMITGKAFT